MKKTTVLLLVIGSLALCQSLAMAKETERDLKDAARKLDRAAASPGGTEKVTQSLSEKFSVPPATIRDLRAQKMGFGEIGILLALSQATGKTPSQLLQRFKSGEGWGKIAKSEGIKLGRVIRAVEKAHPPSSRVESKGRVGKDSSNVQQGKSPAENAQKASHSERPFPGQEDGREKRGLSPGGDKGSPMGASMAGGMGHGGKRK